MTGQEPETIREASSRCLNLFVKNLNIESVEWILEETDENVQDNLHDELVRFKLWESNIGVFAHVHASLDFRLRDVPDVAELFLRQLDTIEQRLQQGTPIFFFFLLLLPSFPALNVFVVLILSSFSFTCEHRPTCHK